MDKEIKEKIEKDVRDKERRKRVRSNIMFAAILTLGGSLIGSQVAGLDPIYRLIHFVSGTPYETPSEKKERYINSKIEKLFSNYDLDRDGVIDRQETRRYFEENY